MIYMHNMKKFACLQHSSDFCSKKNFRKIFTLWILWSCQSRLRNFEFNIFAMIWKKWKNQACCFFQMWCNINCFSFTSIVLLGVRESHCVDLRVLERTRTKTVGSDFGMSFWYHTMSDLFLWRISWTFRFFFNFRFFLQWTVLWSDKGVVWFLAIVVFLLLLF